MYNPIGVMQGRLLPKFHGRYQAHPVGYWQDEFPIAKNLGLDCVEVILDYNDLSRNPLTSHDGLEKLKRVVNKTGVEVQSICADYFMQAPLHASDAAVRQNSLVQLESLISSAAVLGVRDVVIPCVDQSSLLEPVCWPYLIGALHEVQPVLEETGVNLSLETDLGPEEFARLLDRIGLSQVTVNYDTGNSAALGYDTEEELNAYGHSITDVHIKDRRLGSGPIEVGAGDADIKRTLSLLSALNYTGPFIMQAFRDDEGIAVFSRQLSLFRNMLTSVGY